MNINIAVVQFAIAPFRPQDNLEKAERFIQQAASAQAHIIVFPEDFVTGPLNGDHAYADVDQTYVRYFQQLAARYALAIVPGSIIERHEHSLYNTTYYIDHTGAILGRYRKMNLWLPERGSITPGDKVAVFPTAYGRIGLAICWDLMFPEHFRSMLRQNVEIVICPSYWCFEDAGVGMRYAAQAEVTLVNALCIARAFENNVALVYANAAGSLDNNGIAEHLIGRSQITLPFMGAIARVETNEETMVLQEIDLAILRDAEQSYAIRRDLKGRLYPL